jgi:outer membrane protein assembly factor BamD (BamD/ComL family)
MIVSAMIIVSCGGPSKDKELTKIKELEKKMAAKKDGVIDKEKTKELIAAYKDFADKFPKDTASAICLFKAAQLSLNIMYAKDAIQLYDRIIKDFPDYSKTPDCLLSKGFIYETELKDLGKARQCYEDFVKKYPKHDYTDDAQVSIKNIDLGKSPEDLIKEFEARDKAKADSAKTSKETKKVLAKK